MRSKLTGLCILVTVWLNLFELAELKQEKKATKINAELRSKEYNLLFYGIATAASQETSLQSEIQV